MRQFLVVEFALLSVIRERALAVDNQMRTPSLKKTLLSFCFKEPLSDQEGVLFFKGQLTNDFNILPASWLADSRSYRYLRIHNIKKTSYQFQGITVKPDVLLMGTLQTSASTLVFD